MKTSPTQRSLALLRKQGYLAAIVEKWNPHARIRQDMFGCVDLFAIKPGERLAIQACSAGDVARRVAKIKALRAWRIMLAAGLSVRVWGWGKRGARGKRKVWTLREVIVEPERPMTREELERAAGGAA